ATAPKSNAAYVAIDAALDRIKQGDTQPVPHYLRTRQSQAMASEKSDKHYKYPHDYPYSMVSQDYWDNAEQFYKPKAIGFEREIQKRMNWARQAKKSGDC
ncbi:MAG: replication-associated recombination protein A, partial [Candidatus Margulisbacteria bacterium]|nr:replication-associated recombination protein A [Candidatus Margulisiibacteriota bacterium]